MTSHLDALQLRLSRERGYLAASKSANEVALRQVWIRQIEKEINLERGYAEKGSAMSDDELLAELGL